MKQGEFKIVTRFGRTIGVIHLRDDGCYWAIAYDVHGKTIDDSLDSEELARNYIKRSQIVRGLR